MRKTFTKYFSFFRLSQNPSYSLLQTRLLLEQVPTQNSRKISYFGDVIFEYIKQWLRRKRSASNSPRKKSSKRLKQIMPKSRPPDLAKNCQGGCGWKGDSSGKQLRESEAISAVSGTHSPSLTDWPHLHRAPHAAENARQHLRANSFFTPIESVQLHCESEETQCCVNDFMLA